MCRSNVRYLCHFKSADNAVVMVARRLDGLLSNSGEKQFDRIQPIHAEIPL